MYCPHCAKRGEQTQLVKKVEGGGLLMRGTAPIVRLVDGGLVLDQKCPVCRKLTRYKPMTIRLVSPKRGGDGEDEE